MIVFFGVMGIMFCCCLFIAAVFGVFRICDWVKDVTQRFETLEQDYRDLAADDSWIAARVAQLDDRVRDSLKQLSDHCRKV